MPDKKLTDVDVSSTIADNDKLIGNIWIVNTFWDNFYENILNSLGVL